LLNRSFCRRFNRLSVHNTSSSLSLEDVETRTAAAASPFFVQSGAPPTDRSTRRSTAAAAAAHHSPSTVFRLLTSAGESPGGGGEGTDAGSCRARSAVDRIARRRRTATAGERGQRRGRDGRTAQPGQRLPRWGRRDPTGDSAAATAIPRVNILRSAHPHARLSVARTFPPSALFARLRPPSPVHDRPERAGKSRLPFDSRLDSDEATAPPVRPSLGRRGTVSSGPARLTPGPERPT